MSSHSRNRQDRKKAKDRDDQTMLGRQARLMRERAKREAIERDRKADMRYSRVYDVSDAYTNL